MLRSRESFDLIRDYIVPKKYSKEFQILTDKIADYYLRDVEVPCVEPQILFAQLEETIRSEKHLDVFKKAIQEAMDVEGIPEQNIKEIIFQAKRQEKADELATALVNNPKGAVSLAKEFLDLAALTSLDEVVTAGTEIVEEEDLDGLIEKELDPTGRLKVYPSALNERLGGGLKGGHHCTIFGRPEAAKTALAITIASGFLMQGAEGLYIGNEDRRHDLVMRVVSCLSGMNKEQIQRDPKKAIELANNAGFKKIKIIAMSPGSLGQIDALVNKYKPKWIVVDQLRNLNVQNESRVNQLEAAAQGIRNIGKKYNVITIDVTQAGDSGDGKAVLEMGDIDFSNTGIPAAADVLIGVGVTPALELEGRRWLNLPKNKISGKHENFPVKLDTALSRYSSVS